MKSAELPVTAITVVNQEAEMVRQLNVKQLMVCLQAEVTPDAAKPFTALMEAPCWATTAIVLLRQTDAVTAADHLIPYVQDTAVAVIWTDPPVLNIILAVIMAPGILCARRTPNPASHILNV